ncbi:MAG: hypothetical protein C7B44_07725 [Sulfobacillus thermosulfidooxidans]|nr:MAG: hypothetical protein C7B44_07725 [Sulfobacillus thermosulfidooxidans]
MEQPLRWTILVNSWAMGVAPVWQALEPLADSVQDIIWMELGPWHRQVELPPQCRLGPAWQGSFAEQYDRAYAQTTGNVVLLLEGGEIVRRMDWRQLEEAAQGPFEALALPVARDKESTHQEIRVLKRPAAVGFRGAIRANSAPELLAFCEPIGDIDVEVDASEAICSWAPVVQDLLRDDKVPWEIKARAALEMRQYSVAMDWAKRALGRRALPSSQSQVALQLIEAQALLGQERFKDTWRLCVSLLSRHPSADAVYTAAQALMGLERFEEAAAYYTQLGSGLYGKRQFQEPGADSYRAWLGAARAFRAMRRDKDSFDILIHILSEYPFFREAWQEMFRLLPAAEPKELYALLTHSIAPSKIREFFSRLTHLTEPEDIFRHWLGV